MPYPNFHAARMIDPNKFQSIVQLKELPNGIRLIGGKLKGEQSSTVQAYRFPKEKFTVSQAKAWLKKEKLSPMLFEPASEQKESDETDMCKKQKDSVNRFDVFNDIQEYMIEPFKKTPEGFLKGRAIVTNTGIFNYTDKQGNMLRELRSPEEVFSDKSLKSLEMIPATNNHPGEGVSVLNAKGLQVGYTGQDVRVDGHAVSVPLVITDEETIKEIENGKCSLSCGYGAELEFKTGYAFGNNQYDCIQRDIVYNHIAIVDRGRAGDLARMKFTMDSDAILIDSVSVSNDIDNNIKGEIMKKIILDGVEYEAEAKVIETITKYKEDSAQKDKTIEEKNNEISKLQADKDQLSDDIEKLKSEKLSDEDIKLAVKDRLSVLSVASKLKVDCVDSLTNKDVKKAIIKSQYPAAQLDDKDDVYINARFDAIVEKLDETVTRLAEKENKTRVLGDNIPNTQANKESKKDSLAEKRKAFCDGLEKECETYTGAASVK